MRKAYNDNEIISENGIVIGINLGWDYCAEHEWGIAGLQSDFGLELEEKLGYEARKNTLVPIGLKFNDTQSPSLIYAPGHSEYSISCLLKGKFSELSLREGKELATAWDERSFGIHTVAKNGNILEGLHNAFQSKNGVITMAEIRNPFARSGLLLLDYSKIPEERRNEVREEDRKYREEQAMYRKMEKESGVLELIEKSGKQFHSLRIQKLDDKGQPLWWLNPFEQRTYKAGWFTTEQLKQWAENECPIIAKSD